MKAPTLDDVMQGLADLTEKVDRIATATKTTADEVFQIRARLFETGNELGRRVKLLEKRSPRKRKKAA